MVTITVTPAGGFNQAVALSCSGLPTGGTCNFSPASVTPSGAAVSSALTVNAPSSIAFLPVGTSLPRSPFPVTPLGGCIALAAIAAMSLMRRLSNSATHLRPWSWAVGLLVLLSVGFLGACNGGSKKPVMATVTVTGTSGAGQSAITHTTTINLTVTP